MKIDTASSTPALLTTLQAYKSVAASYTQRVRHAEEMVATLMEQHLDKDTFVAKVVNRVTQHMTEIEAGRSTQYLLVLKATLLSLQEIQKRNPDPSLVETIKAISLAIGKN